MLDCRSSGPTSCLRCSTNWSRSSTSGVRGSAFPSSPMWPTATSSSCADDRADGRLPARAPRLASRQCVFLTSHFDALSPRWLESSHRLATAYLHGRPGTPGAPEFDDAFHALRRDPGRLARVQVTHQEMRELVLA